MHEDPKTKLEILESKRIYILDLMRNPRTIIKYEEELKNINDQIRDLTIQISKSLDGW